jgi:hypothetical protein
MLRQRDSEHIRGEAIKMGIHKAKSGCFACAERYFELAQQHGATEEEIHQALESTEKTTGRLLSRRDLLKTVTVAGLALGTAGVLATNAQAHSTWWGTDSGTQTCCGMPQDFYVGRMGYGVEPAGDPYFFNRSAAASAGLYHTYGYWGVVGPDSRPSKKSPYVWGQNQADYAWNAWHNGPSAELIGGLTVFGDVEPGFGGWSSGNHGPNQEVISGFLDELFDITPPFVWPGLYISPYYWSGLLGRDFIPKTDFVLWIAGCDTCGGDIANPCDSSNDAFTTVQHRVASTVAHIGLGKRRPVLWQYWIDSCTCGDFNVASQYAKSFSPVKGGTTYSSC